MPPIEESRPVRSSSETIDVERPPLWKIILREGSLYFGLIVVFLIGLVLDLVWLEEPVFLTLNNQGDVLRTVSQNGILAVGMTMVILTAGIDLSVGRMLGLGSVLAAMLLIYPAWTAATWVTLPLAAVAAGILAAMIARTLLVRERRGWRATAVSGVAFVAVAAIVAAWTVPQVSAGLGIVTVLVTVPLAGLMLGGVSGVVIAKFRLQPFIVTLAMMITAFGASRIIASSEGGGYIHSLFTAPEGVRERMDWLRLIDTARLADALGGGAPEWLLGFLRADATQQTVEVVPIPGLFFLVCLGSGIFILRRLRFGRYVYAIGSNEETARLSGVPVDRIKISVYAISGMLAFLAGVLNCAQYRQGKPETGAMAELDAIAAVVIGGTSLMGGRGRMIGTLVGVLIFGYLTNILSIHGIKTDVQYFVTGLIIVGAVLLQEGFRRR